MSDERYAVSSSTLPAEVASGKWSGRWYEQACSACGCMLAHREPPKGDSRCASCRGETELAQIYRTIRELKEERDAWEGRAKKAEQALNEACDDIHELRAQLAALAVGAAE